MYLIDTNVISEVRKGKKANPGVQDFFAKAAEENQRLYLSVITIGDLRRGVEKIRHRGDGPQAELLNNWLATILFDYAEYLPEFDEVAAQVWGKLRVPHHEHVIDKQIAATALIHDLTVVTRNTDDFVSCGVKLVNPFSG